MVKRTKAVFLLRNSDPSQDMSLASQREQCERYARDNRMDVLRSMPGIPKRAFMDGAFIDESVSGARTDRRVGFQAMLTACEATTSRIRYVVCYDISRFGRFDNDEAGHYRHRLKQAGVELRYLAEGLRGDETDDLVVGVKQWQGRKYLKDLSKVTQRGLIRLAQQGYWVGGLPPFGFDLRYEDSAGQPLCIARFMSDGSKQLLELDGQLERVIPRGEKVIHASCDRARLCPSTDKRTAIVREIFESYAAGHGYKHIAETLNKRGIPAPRDGRWSKRHKAGWSHGTIRNILHNAAYIGNLVYNRSSFSQFSRITNGANGPQSVPAPGVRRRKTEKLPASDWIIAKDAHPALITTELWERAQSARSTRRKPHARGATSEYIFSGLLDCQACAHHFQGHTTTKGKPRRDGTRVRTRSYLCGGYVSKGTAVCPARWAVNEDQLWTILRIAVASKYGWLFNSDDFTLAIQQRAEEIIGRPTRLGPDVDEWRRRRAEIDCTVNDLVENLAPQNLALLDDRLTELRKERECLEERINAAEAQVDAPKLQAGKRLKNAIKSIRNAFRAIDTASPGLKRRFMREFVDRIELDPREKTGVAWIAQLPLSVLDSLGVSVSRIAGAGLEPATSGL